MPVFKWGLVFTAFKSGSWAIRNVPSNRKSYVLMFTFIPNKFEGLNSCILHIPLGTKGLQHCTPEAAKFHGLRNTCPICSNTSNYNELRGCVCVCGRELYNPRNCLKQLGKPTKNVKQFHIQNILPNRYVSNKIQTCQMILLSSFHAQGIQHAAWNQMRHSWH
jgi:hypothetical protein